MVLETKRLLLREMNPDDYQALFPVFGDPETMWHYPYTFDGQHVRDWIKRNMNRYRKDGFGLRADTPEHIRAKDIREFYITSADAIACVKSTCFNMTKTGYAVHVISDCVTSYDIKKIPEMTVYLEERDAYLEIYWIDLVESGD